MKADILNLFWRNTVSAKSCEINWLKNHTAWQIRKLKEKNGITEYFSCLCWIEIPEEDENLNVLAVGATNGHIYLLSYKYKIMFGHIELPVSYFFYSIV